MKLPQRRIACALFSFAALCLAAGCATDKTTAKAPPSSESNAQKETVSVNSMGSWIPRKVKKKEDVLGDTSSVASGEALQKVQTQGLSNVQKDIGPR